MDDDGFKAGLWGQRALAASFLGVAFVVGSTRFAVAAEGTPPTCTSESWVAIGISTVAIVVGPIFAVLVTRWIDDMRLRRTRRMEVFRTLMRTRRLRLSADHVGALNLVEIEFEKDTAVIAAWRAYFEHLSNYPATTTPEADTKLFEISSSHLTKLLHAIAKALNFKIEQLDILEGGYAPRGWDQSEIESQATRRQLLNVLQGQQPLRVVLLPAAAHPFPPVPTPVEKP